MKVVKVEVTSPNKDDNAPARVLVETNRGGLGWVRDDARDMTTNKGAETFNLRPGQRVIIETNPDVEMVYDRDQAASINPNTQRNDENRADRTEPLSDQDKKKFQVEADRLDKQAKADGRSVPDRNKLAQEAGAEAARRAEEAAQRDTRPGPTTPITQPAVARPPEPDKNLAQGQIRDAELRASTKPSIPPNPAPETSSEAAKPKSGPDQNPEKK